MSPRTRSRSLDAALTYAERGWPVLPCHSPSPHGARCSCGQLDCGSPGKHPRIKGGLNSASTEPGQIERWWSTWPDANVAIRTGAVSGMVVVDIDPDHGGDATMRDLIAEHGEPPPGRVVETGSGGRHLFFRHPGDVVRNDAGRRLGPGIDIRGDGGYVIAPPSRHASGGEYRLAGPGAELPDLPDWLAHLIQPPEPTRRELAREWRPIGDTTAWAKAAVEGELERLRCAQPGIRNHTLNKVSFRLGQIIASGALDPHEVEGLLVDNGLAIGLNEHETIATVHSGLNAGENHPRGPRGQQETEPKPTARDEITQPTIR